MAYSYATRRQGSRTPRAPARKMGTWKLAYADFLTALMAFFLVMWMVSNDQESRAGVAEYFSGETTVANELAVTPLATDDANSELADQLRSAPELADHARNIAITAAADHVTLDLFDTDNRPLFASGDGRLNDTGASLVSAAGTVLARHGWVVSIEGHTDRHPSADPDKSNWELSTLRANTARRLMTAAGLKDVQVRAVTGLASTRPLIDGKPYLPANRRISIVIHVTD